MTAARAAREPDGLLLRRARLWGRGAPTEISVAEGRIAAIGPDAARTVGEGAGVREVDLDGAALLPAFVEPHIHLDKAFTRELGPATTLADAATLARSALTESDGMAERVRRALAALAAHGVRMVRSHVNVGPGYGLANLRTVMEIADQMRDEIAVQTVAFADRLLEPEAPGWELLGDALDLGCTAIGGSTTRRADPAPFLEAICRLAAERGCPVDLHIDEHLEPSCKGLSALVSNVRRFGLQGRAVAGHSCALGVAPEPLRARLVAALAEQEIGIVVLPLTNLYLQGRDSLAGTGPRGLAPIEALLAAGVRVACGTDNLQDPYLPFGNGDPQLALALAGIAGQVSQGRGQEWLTTAMTTAAANILGFPGIGLSAGCQADLIAIDSRDTVLMTAPAPIKAIIRSGRLVNRDEFSI